MEDLRNVVDHYADELTGSRADDAFHSLLELGPVALPHIAAALRLTRDSTVKRRLAEVICESRSIEALPLLGDLLVDEDTEIWKTALDGLVTLGEEPTGRARALEVLVGARESASSEKREWIDEAVGQVSAANGPT